MTGNDKELTNLERGRGIKSKTVLLKIICELVGINYHRTKVKLLWTNKIAEKVIREVEDDTPKIEAYESLESAVTSILYCQDIHNFRYQMEILNYKIPYQVTMEWFVKGLKLFLKYPDKLLTIG